MSACVCVCGHRGEKTNKNSFFLGPGKAVETFHPQTDQDESRSCMIMYEVQAGMGLLPCSADVGGAEPLYLPTSWGQQLPGQDPGRGEMHDRRNRRLDGITDAV